MHTCGRMLMGLGLGAGLLALTTPAQAAPQCLPLQAIGETGSIVSKRVSPNQVLFVRDNWVTDFAVPPGARFAQFVATVTSRTISSASGEARKLQAYSVQVSLRYPENNEDRMFDQTVELDQGVPLDIQVWPRSYSLPETIRLRVGGDAVIGSDYTVSVAGCSS